MSERIKRLENQLAEMSEKYIEVLDKYFLIENLLIKHDNAAEKEREEARERRSQDKEKENKKFGIWERFELSREGRLKKSLNLQEEEITQFARIADALEKMVNCRNETASGLPNPRDAVFGPGPRLEQVSEMTTEQYEKNRDRILAQIKAEETP